MFTLKPLMTLKDFEAQFSVSRSTIYREVGAGRLKLTKVGRASRIAAADAISWLSRQRSPSAFSS